MKLHDVEWFAVRRPEILSQRAADRKTKVAALAKKGDPLARDYAKAAARAEAGVRMARLDGEYPLLSGGDVNIYSLFVERALKLVKPDGTIGLLTPSGIASDKTAAPFFKGLSTGGRLRGLYDFENKGVGRPHYFPDVHPQFKFCALIASRTPSGNNPARCAFFLNDPSEIENPDRCFVLTAADFARLNPNTGTAPLFRTRRDATLTAGIYGRLPVLVDRSTGTEVKSWPVVYSTTYHMTNDSGLFCTREELDEQEGAYAVRGNRFKSAKGEWVPLYEGKMIWHFDHRAASVLVNPENQHRPAFPRPTELKEHRNPAYTPTPQFWILATNPSDLDRYALAFRDVTNSDRSQDFGRMFCSPQVCRQHASACSEFGSERRGICVALRKFQRYHFGLCCAAEGSEKSSQLVHRRTASRRPCRTLPNQAFWKENRRSDCPGSLFRADLHFA